MPKLTNLSDLPRVLTPVVKNSPYFLFMLGTDTQYTPRPTKDPNDPRPTAYDNGETLSFMARLITEKLGERGTETDVDKNPHQPSFSAPSVDVVNGPTTLGTEVGDRIAQGVFLALKALMEGKEILHITAHSRGAVESLIITHELDRIKKELRRNPTQTLYQVLLNSQCPYTRRAFSGAPFGELNEEAVIRTRLAERLEAAKIHVFLMDPVPGGSYLLESLAWRGEEHFYSTPPCSSIEILLSRDERTCCFKPIIPENVTPTIIPGNHGTMSGNLYTQQGERVPESCGPDRDTSLVQKLVVRKLISFIDARTQIFSSNIEPVSIEHNVLESIANAYLQTPPPLRNRKILELYEQIHRSDKAYRFMATRGYKYLGTEQHPDGTRYIHLGAHNSLSLGSIALGAQGQYINTEHAQLFLQEHIGFNINGDNPIASMNELKLVLNMLFIGYEWRDANSYGLLNDPKLREMTFAALSVILDTISKKFLQNNLSLVDKTRLLDEIESTFEGLKIFKEPETQKIALECESRLKNSIKNTAETYYQYLITQSKMLHSHINAFLTSEAEFTTLNKEPFNEVNYLTELEQLFFNIESVIEGRNRLQSLAGKDPLSIDMDLLEMHQARIVDLVAKIMIKKERNPTIKPACIQSTVFFNKVRAQAIAQGPHITFLEEGIAKREAHITDQERLIATHRQQISEYETNIRLLTEQNTTQRQQITHLTTQAKDKEQEVARLNEVIQTRENLIAQLNIHKTTLELQIQHETQQYRLELTTQEEQHRQAIAVLSTQHDKDVQTLADIGRQNEEHLTLIAALETQNKGSQDTVNQLALQLQQTEKLNQQLQTPKEIKCAHFIENDLLPSTKKYLVHLLNEMQKIDPSLVIDDYIADISLHLPEPPNREMEEQYQLIAHKYSIVQDLFEKLTDSSTNPLPSERIMQFATSLKEKDAELGQHRDSAWTRFVQNTLVTIGIICSGVIPGVLALIAYSIYTNNSSPLFFTQSRGRCYVEHTNEVLNSVEISV